MALQFRPPEDLINAYLNRPSPGQQVSEGINQALQTYAQQKAQQQQQAIAQQSKDVETAKALTEGGTDFTNNLSQIQAQRNQPQSQGTSLIDRAKAFFSNPSQTTSPLVPSANPGPMSVPDGSPMQSVQPPTPSTGTVAGVSSPITSGPSTDPLIQEYMKDPAAFKQKHGTGGIAKLKTQFEIDKGIQEKAPKPNEGYYDASGKKKFEVPAGSHLLPAADLNIGTKESNQQDKLEEQYRKSFQQIRGDPSIKRTEEQRDAAAIAYNRIKEVKDHGQVLNPIDYVDVLGQIYKARTGSAPTNEVLSSARQATAKGNFGKAFTFLTGEQAPATTQDIMQSLQDMAKSMGEQADKFHDGYMKSRMKPPLGLAHDRVANVAAERGMSFAEATGQNGGSGKTQKIGRFTVEVH